MESPAPLPETPRRSRRTWLWWLGLIAIIPLVPILLFVGKVRGANRYLDEARVEVRRGIQVYQGQSVRRPPYFEPAVEGDAWSVHAAAIGSIMEDLSTEECEIIDGDPDAEEEESATSERKAIIQKVEGLVGSLRRGLSHTWVTPDFNWELGLEQKTFVLKGQLTFFRALALVGRERGREGRQAEALDVLATGMAIAEDLSTNGALVAELVKEASQDRLRDEISRILADHSVPAPALRELLRLLEAIEARRNGIASVMSRELLCMKVSALTAMDSITGMNWGLNPMPRYWFSNRVLMADAQRTFDRIAEDIERLRGKSPREVGDAQPWARHYDNPNPIVSILAPSMARAWSSEKRARARSTLQRCAVAIACHQAETGRTPAALNDLIPKYLAALPGDPYAKDGTLAYRSDGHVATVYSLGEDGDDDGGKAAPEGDLGTRDCDIVWTVKRRS